LEFVQFATLASHQLLNLIKLQSHLMAAATAIIAPPPPARKEADPLRRAIAKSTRMRVTRETGVGALQRLPAGKDMTDFSSNDFLSLANSEEMKLAFLKKLNAMDGCVSAICHRLWRLFLYD